MTLTIRTQRLMDLYWLNKTLATNHEKIAQIFVNQEVETRQNKLIQLTKKRLC